MMQVALNWADDNVPAPALYEALTDEAHVWLAHPRNAGFPATRTRYEGLLSTDERERYVRFHFERNRLEFLVAHALVRTTLSRYVAVAPSRWAFRTNRYGRPEIESGARAPPLRFNLSHTDGLVACVISKTVDCGIDIEQERPLKDLMALARSVFAPAEFEALAALPEHLRHRRFYACWTLKESYIKARGMGLSLPLDGFSFDIDAAGQITSLSMKPSVKDKPAGWQFSLGQASETHKLAVALRRGTSTDLRVVCRYSEP
jgi:4'-phosphopantetheinyl transferase